MGFQEKYFATGGGDAYFERNAHCQSSAREVPGVSKRILEWASAKSQPGTLCVVGGAAGPEAAYFSSLLRGWKIVNVDISEMAIEHGRSAFPEVEHVAASLTEENLREKIGQFDCVLVTGVLCWIERSLLSRAILNLDEIVCQEGILVIQDFFPPSPRKNPISHADSFYTYKQDYSQLFVGLGVFRVISQSFWVNDDQSYAIEDRLKGYSVLEKTDS